MRMWSVLCIGVRGLRSPTPARYTVRRTPRWTIEIAPMGPWRMVTSRCSSRSSFAAGRGGGAGAGRAGEQHDQGDQSSADHGERC